MILALDKHAALYIFSSAIEAERELEAIDVQQDEIEFYDLDGRRYFPTYTIPPKITSLGAVEIGAFKLSVDGGIDPELPRTFIERATHIEHTSIPTIATKEALRKKLCQGA